MRRLLRASLLVSLCCLAFPAQAHAQEPAIFDDCGDSYQATFVGWTNTDTGWIVTGPLEVRCDEFRLFVDGEVEGFELEDGGTMIHARARAKGGVTFVQEDLSISADRLEMNSRTRLGDFYQAAGHADINAPTERSQFGTQEGAFDFWAERISRVGPRTYKAENAGFTTCGQPTPRWQIGGSSGTIEIGDHVSLSHAVLRVKNVPLLYLPWMRYPINDQDRSTGFLLPTYSSSTIRGTGISNAFFLVLGRSQDATFFHDWFATSGQGYGAEYRYQAAPGSQGDVRFYLFDESDRLGSDGVTIERTARRSFELNGNMIQSLPRGFQLRGYSNYRSDQSTSQLYHQSLYDFSSRQRSIGVRLDGNVGGLRVSSTTEQRDIFYGETAQRRGLLPSVRISRSQRAIGRSKVYFGASGQVGHLIRRDDLDDPTTDFSLWRIDAAPSLRVPLSSLPFLNVTSTATYRWTRWFESLDPETGLPVSVPITRQLIEFGTSVEGPTVARVWQTPDSGYAERLKHVIQPKVSVKWISPFDELDQVIKIDGIDHTVGGTTTVTYGVVNRLLARRNGQAQDILTVDINQTYYSNQLAAAFDGQYQSATGSTSFSAVRINVDARPTERLTGHFNTEIDPVFRTPRQFSATGRYGGDRVQFSAGWSKRQLIPGLPGYDNPLYASHFINGSTTLRSASGSVGGTYEFNFDILNSSLLQQRIIAYYNAQCCGVQFDYQTVSIARFGFSGVPTDRRFGISFTLAGIGSFSNPLGSFGDNGRR